MCGHQCTRPTLHIKWHDITFVVKCCHIINISVDWATSIAHLNLSECVNMFIRALRQQNKIYSNYLLAFIYRIWLSIPFINELYITMFTIHIRADKTFLAAQGTYLTALVIQKVCRRVSIEFVSTLIQECWCDPEFNRTRRGCGIRVPQSRVRVLKY